MVKFPKPFALACLFFSVLVVDAAVKAWTHWTLPVMDHTTLWYPYGGIGVFHNVLGVEFSISHAVNTGTAWGLFDTMQLPLVALRTVLLIGMAIYLAKYNRDPSQEAPLVMVMGGALGNIIDYFVYGHVVDMFHFVLWGYDYPVFNVADSAICVGVCWLMLRGLLHDMRLRREQQS